MVEVLLHLWRASWFFSNNQHQMMDLTRFSEVEEEMFARGNGTMERFILRVHRNDSTSIVHLKFFVNGNLLREIVLDGALQTGTFLPSNQLPLSFFKDDRLVMQFTGIATGNISAEISCE